MRGLLLGVLLALGAPSLHAQGPAPVRVETRNGVLEIHGLRSWTVDMLNDSLRMLAPDLSLDSPACAANLTRGLGFAGAGVMPYGKDSLTGNKLTTITLAEPAMKTKFKLRSEFPEEWPTKPEYLPMYQLWRDDPSAAQSALQMPERLFDTTGTADLTNMAGTQKFRDLLQPARDPRVQAEARNTLTSDGNVQNRIAAALMLSAGLGNDTTYWALIDAFRDSSDLVKSAASLSLFALSKYEHRRVDWAPAAESLRAAFSGANLFHDQMLHRSLAASQIDSLLARDVTREGQDLLLSELRSQAAYVRQGVRRC